MKKAKKEDIPVDDPPTYDPPPYESPVCGHPASENVDEHPRLSPPWITFQKELYELFKDDPELTISITPEDAEPLEFEIETPNMEKAQALAQILPPEKTFGNNKLKIIIKVRNEKPDPAKLFRKAFANNPVVTDVITINPGSTNAFTYVMFKNKVIQFWNDNLNDPHGNMTTLYQTIAEDVFKPFGGIYYSTDYAEPEVDGQNCTKPE